MCVKKLLINQNEDKRNAQVPKIVSEFFLLAVISKQQKE